MTFCLIIVQIQLGGSVFCFGPWNFEFLLFLSAICFLFYVVELLCHTLLSSVQLDFLLPSCTHIIVKLEKIRVCSLYLRGISVSSLNEIVYNSTRNLCVFMIFCDIYRYMCVCVSVCARARVRFAQLNVFLFCA